ncbi:MAG: PIN/TRAM domain-containing protein [Eubacteriales bacterium]|nr:PIN/TRAM domain-containing protein [Eubacteriales bacterium]
MRKVLRIIIALVGIGIGCGIVAWVLYSFKCPGYDYVLRYTTIPAVMAALYVIVGILFGIIFFILSPKIIDGVHGFFQKLEHRLTEMPALDILFGVIGIMIGMLFAFLLSLIMRTIDVPVLPEVITLLLYFICGYYGGHIGVTRRAELMDGYARRGHLTKGIAAGNARPKVLDTSVIIDGRIYDICKTGFLEGKIIVPAFVLKELRHIADSSDAMKRARGRRGLDILHSMQRELDQRVEVEEKDYEDIDEVDLKLLRLAGDIGGILMTNDYNLNKVAAVQNMPVLNINDLANAVRSVLLPGEELPILIAKEGKESGQGVGYLPDGTMVIVENAKKHIGETLDIVVTSALQTSAGRLVFAKLRG